MNLAGTAIAGRCSAVPASLAVCGRLSILGPDATPAGAVVAVRSGVARRRDGDQFSSRLGGMASGRRVEENPRPHVFGLQQGLATPNRASARVLATSQSQRNARGNSARSTARQTIKQALEDRSKRLKPDISAHPHPLPIGRRNRLAWQQSGSALSSVGAPLVSANQGVGNGGLSVGIFHREFGNSHRKRGA